jgi:50S ribosomal protein L16 3-hydroxylase
MPERQSILGAMPAARFLLDHWQQRPLLIRDALPGYTSPITPDELAGLALEAEVESRIVLEVGVDGPWELRTGPFEAASFETLPETQWTLLVQAVDLWLPEVAALLDHFDFLPRWRLDDIMVSYATPGGSVGPHFDHYDVFLLQVEGTRRWQIGDLVVGEPALLSGTPLRILRDFKATAEWLLTPGDMLYLPPRVAHWGIAESESLTFSIGFRAPTLSDMLGDLATEVMSGDNDRYFRDPPLTVDMATEMIDPAFVTQASHMLRQLLTNDEFIEDWFARYMTTPKYTHLQGETGEARVARTRRHRYRNGMIDEGSR